MDDHQRDFNMKLGHLAIQFSRLEYYAHSILNLLISKDDILVGKIIQDRMAYSKTIDLIKKLSDFKSAYRKEIKKVASDMNELNTIRNQFIHGYWKKPKLGETGYYIEVLDKRAKRIQKKDKSTVIYSSNNVEFITKDQIERIEVRVESLLKRSKNLIEKLENDDQLE